MDNTKYTYQWRIKMRCEFTFVPDKPCRKKALWKNEHGVSVCEEHKLLMDGFNWENRVSRRWQKLTGVLAVCQPEGE